jgi:hypothetical protein
MTWSVPNENFVHADTDVIFPGEPPKLKQFADLLEAGERKCADSRVCEGTRFGDRFQTARRRSS